MRVSVLTMTMKAVMMMMMTIMLISLQEEVEAQESTCVDGDNLSNKGASCNFGSVELDLCEWENMDGNKHSWKNFLNDVNMSPSAFTDTKDLSMNQIVRLKSPLLCATNSTYLHYQLSFDYTIFVSDRCRLSLSVFFAAGDKLTEIWNTQETTYDPRTIDWRTVLANVSNSNSSFYLIFAVERIHSTLTTTVALDTLLYTSTPIPTTTPSPPTTIPPPTSSTTTPTTTTISTTNTPSTTTPAPPTTPPVNNATTATTDKSVSQDVIIAISVSVVVAIVLIIVIAIVCRRVRREEDVKTVSFAMNSPTAYNVNEEKKLTGKRRKDLKARASVLVPSKHSDWQPDRSLY